MKIDFFWYI